MASLMNLSSDELFAAAKECEESVRAIGNNIAVDNINHPAHYQANGIETIDVIEAWTKDLDGIVAVCTANVIKYISRWNKKNGVEDLKKAQWYLNKLIEILSRE